MGKQATTTAPSVDPPQFELLDLDRLHPSPANPRHDIGDVGELAASIKELGIIEPLIVTPNGDGFILVAGHRRHAAAVRAGVRQAPCVVRPGLDEKAQAEIRVVENLHRQDLTPLEEAEAFKALIDLGYSQRALEKKISRSQAHISRRLSLLKLPEKARAAVDTGDITVEDATTLARVSPDRVEALFKRGRPSPYEIGNAVREQELSEKDAEARKALLAAGVSIVEKMPGPAWKHRLSGPGNYGLELTPEEHTGEPCHAAEVGYGAKVTYVCTDPARHEPGGDSALQVLERPTDDEDDEEEVPEPGEAPAAFDARQQAAEAARAIRTARAEERRRAIDARRAYAALLIEKLDAAGAIDLLAMAFGEITCIEDPFDDRMLPDLLGITLDTYNQATVAGMVKAYMAKGPRNRARALSAVAVAALERDATPAGGEWNLGAERCVIDDEDFQRSTKAWLSFLAEHGYALTDHDRELVPEPEPPAEPQPDDTVAWYDDPEEGPRWVTEDEADVMKGVDPNRLHPVDPALTPEQNPPEVEDEPSPTITVKKVGKRWTVTCSACGDIGHNTTQTYADERGQTHMNTAHRLVESEVSA